MLQPASSLNSNLRFSQFMRFGLLATASFGFNNTLLARNLETFQSGYLDAQYQSQGDLIRVLPPLTQPAFVFLI